jgi:hypothetical protein
MQRKDRGYFDPYAGFGARPRVKPDPIQPAPAAGSLKFRVAERNYWWLFWIGGGQEVTWLMLFVMPDEDYEALAGCNDVA